MLSSPSSRHLLYDQESPDILVRIAHHGEGEARFSVSNSHPDSVSRRRGCYSDGLRERVHGETGRHGQDLGREEGRELHVFGRSSITDGVHQE